jgi:hypothetical protein
MTMGFSGGSKPCDRNTVINPHTVICVTQDGKERGRDLVGKPSVLGVVLNHLAEFSPRTAQEIVEDTGVHLLTLRQVVRQNPTYFQVRTQ